MIPWKYINQSAYSIKSGKTYFNHSESKVLKLVTASRLTEKTLYGKHQSTIKDLSGQLFESLLEKNVCITKHPRIVVVFEDLQVFYE